MLSCHNFQLTLSLADYSRYNNSMAENGQYCVHVHTLTSGRSFCPLIIARVAALMSVPSVAGLASISCKSQKNDFNFYRKTHTQTDTDVHTYIVVTKENCFSFDILTCALISAIVKI